MSLDERAAWLLSKAALPVIEIPVSPNADLRRFRLPSSLPVSPSRPPPPPRRRSTEKPADMSDGRFHDRTLSWFAIGEQLEAEAEDQTLTGLARAPTISGWIVIAAAAALGTTAAIALWW